MVRAKEFHNGQSEFKYLPVEKSQEQRYSARFYKAVVGMKIEAVFCVCPDHPLYNMVSICRGIARSMSMEIKTGHTCKTHAILHCQ